MLPYGFELFEGIHTEDLHPSRKRLATIPYEVVYVIVLRAQMVIKLIVMFSHTWGLCNRNGPISLEPFSLRATITSLKRPY